MTLHIGLLRAVNVGGRKKVAMAALRGLLVGLGMTDVRTLLQSGNVVFRSDVRSAARLEMTLRTAAVEQLDLDTEFFVRTASEWKGIVAGNPFAVESRRDPAHLVVMLLKRAPDRSAIAALRKAIPGRERFQVKGRCAYFVYPDGIGRSRLTAAVIEGKLGTSTTGRNWNTVLKLEAAADTM